MSVSEGGSDRPGPSAATRSEQMGVVAEMVAAGSALLLDWTQGSVQRVRVTDCGFARCDYASCRLANAIIEYLRLADKEDYAAAKRQKTESWEPESRPMFEPKPGEPQDECPNCGIWREHAGNPASCGGGYQLPGCFHPEAGGTLTPKPDIEGVERDGLREAFGRRENKPYTKEDYERDRRHRGKP